MLAQPGKRAIHLFRGLSTLPLSEQIDELAPLRGSAGWVDRGLRHNRCDSVVETHPAALDPLLWNPAENSAATIVNAGRAAAEEAIGGRCKLGRGSDAEGVKKGAGTADAPAHL
jgi:hypothetical protein